jgi:hypothetical protein
MSCVCNINGVKTSYNYWSDVPRYEISSPNEFIPAAKFSDGYKFWWKKGYVWHRLLGPATINSIGEKFYYLNGKRYNNIHDWLNAHPIKMWLFQKLMLIIWK